MILLLGWSSRLRLGHVLCAEVALFTAGLLLVRRAGAEPWKSFLPRLPHAGASTPGILGAGFGLVVIAVVWMACTQPIDDFDSLWYHLPLVARWHSTGTLDVLDEAGAIRLAGQLVTRYPFSWDALGVLFVMPFGDDFLIVVPSLIAWGLAGLALYLVSVSLRASPACAASAALLWMSMPVALRSTRTAHVELASSAFFFVGLYLILDRRRTRSAAGPALFLALLGLLVGIKITGLFLAGVLSLAWVLVNGPRWPPVPADSGGAPRRFPALVLGGAVLAAFVGGFWYVKNYVEVGNPLGHLEVRLFGVELFAGERRLEDVSRTSIGRLFSFTSISDWSILCSEAWTELHAPFLLLLGGTASLPFAKLSGRFTGRTGAVLGICALHVVCAIVYWGGPFTGTAGDEGRITPWIGANLRFALPFAGMLAVGGARVVSDLVRQGTPVALVATAVAWLGLLRATLDLSGPDPEDTLRLAGLHLTVLLALVCFPGLRARVLAPRALAPVLLALAVSGSFGARLLRRARRDWQYGGIVQAIGTSVRPGQPIASIACYRSYPLYGRDLDREVVYLPTKERTAEELAHELQLLGASAVAIGTREEGGELIAAVNARPDVFEHLAGRIDDDAPAELFRLRSR